MSAQPKPTFDNLEADYIDALEAYERRLSEKNGKKTVAGYTRRARIQKGVQQLIVDLVMSRKPSSGFFELVDNGLAEHSFEALVLKHWEHFPPNVIAAAGRRMAQYIYARHPAAADAERS